MEIVTTPAFDKWLNGLKDRTGVAAITKRLVRVAAGNFGDHKALGDGLEELRIFTGPGYRVYFTRRDGMIVVLLSGGDKDSQDRDIEKAREMVAELEG